MARAQSGLDMRERQTEIARGERRRIRGRGIALAHDERAALFARDAADLFAQRGQRVRQRRCGDLTGGDDRSSCRVAANVRSTIAWCWPLLSSWASSVGCAPQRAHDARELEAVGARARNDEDARIEVTSS